MLRRFSSLYVFVSSVSALLVFPLTNVSLGCAWKDLSARLCAQSVHPHCGFTVVLRSSKRARQFTTLCLEP
jgi:hypothetical protein